MPGTILPSQKHNESQKLNYFKWQEIYHTEKPYLLLVDVAEDFPPINFEFEPGPEETIHDLRGQEDRFTLDQHGFAVRSHHFDVTSLDKESVEREYLPEIEKLVRREIENVAEVVCFDWRLRLASTKETNLAKGTVVDLSDLTQYIRPVEAVHIGAFLLSSIPQGGFCRLDDAILLFFRGMPDQSKDGALERVNHHLGERAEDLRKKRIRIVNVWRPLRGPVEDWPLAICDGSTVSAANLVTADVVRKAYVGETLYPLYSADYQWFYLNRQTKDEVFLMKMFDNDKSVKAWCCPHTSFRHSVVAEGALPRESIEVRALVFST